MGGDGAHARHVGLVSDLGIETDILGFRLYLGIQKPTVLGVRPSN